jgi:predicted RNA binding protein YcfA (HicA-like mRNA interferase family)
MEDSVMSYPRRKVMRALASRGFQVVREGSRHTIVGSRKGVTEPVPRHSELNRHTTRRIARNLGIDWREFEKDIT